MLSRRFTYGGDPVTRWTAADLAVAQDFAGNLKSAKDKSTDRIDGIVALRRLPFNREAECNPSFPQPIDFLVFDACAWQLVDEASFLEITYDPVAFIILIAGAIVVALALLTEVAWQPPVWLHLVLWLPLAAILVLGLMRPFKATLIALQYKHRRHDFGEGANRR